MTARLALYMSISRSRLLIPPDTPKTIDRLELRMRARNGAYTQQIVILAAVDASILLHMYKPSNMPETETVTEKSSFDA